MTESVVGLYKNECLKIDGPFRTIDGLEVATVSWLHWFNQNRLHCAIHYQIPLEAEQEYDRHNHPRQQPLPGELGLHWTRGGLVERGSSWRQGRT